MEKKVISDRGKKNRIIACLIITILIIIMSFSMRARALNNNIKELSQKTTDLKKEKLTPVEAISVKNNDRINLAVPMINQMDEPSLFNGCEVASLAMLLQYNGYDVSKNDLAEKIPTVELEKKGLHGDPNEGFVGSITANEGKGYSAYSSVVLSLAEEFIDTDHIVVDLTKKKFDEILVQLLNGHPVWVITTTHFKAPSKMEVWETKNGPVDISWEIHSVALTGFNADYIYLNDPYGEQRKVDKDQFIESWEQMGSQAITIVPTNTTI